LHHSLEADLGVGVKSHLYDDTSTPILLSDEFIEKPIQRHAREIKLHFGKNCLWYEIIEDIARSQRRT